MSKKLIACSTISPTSRIWVVDEFVKSMMKVKKTLEQEPAEIQEFAMRLARETPYGIEASLADVKLLMMFYPLEEITKQYELQGIIGLRYLYFLTANGLDK